MLNIIKKREKIVMNLRIFMDLMRINLWHHIKSCYNHPHSKKKKKASRMMKKEKECLLINLWIHSDKMIFDTNWTLVMKAGKKMML